jgi:hypothetical protein
MPLNALEFALTESLLRGAGGLSLNAQSTPLLPRGYLVVVVGHQRIAALPIPPEAIAKEQTTRK